MAFLFWIAFTLISNIGVVKARGVRIRSDNAAIKLGRKDDIRIVRTGKGELDIQGANLNVDGGITSDYIDTLAIYIDGVPLKNIIKHMIAVGIADALGKSRPTTKAPVKTKAPATTAPAKTKAPATTPKPRKPSACGRKAFKGDGNCDDDNNNAGCEFDGGDCCAKSLGKAVNKDYCKQCKCLDPNPKLHPCGKVDYKGDGNCDDDNNNAGCQFDGGDCCAKTLGKAVNKDYCKQCKCLDPNAGGSKAPTTTAPAKSTTKRPKATTSKAAATTMASTKPPKATTPKATKATTPKATKPATTKTRVTADPKKFKPLLTSSSKEVSVTFQPDLQFSNWKGADLKTKDGANVVAVKGNIKIGSDPGLLLQVNGQVANGKEIELDCTHTGGWKAISELDITTPKMTGEMTIGGDDAFMDGTLSGTMQDKVVMIPGLLTLQPKEKDAKGPTIGLNIEKEEANSETIITPFFDSKICLKLGGANQCLPVRVEPKADEKSSAQVSSTKIYNIWGEFKGGDIKPLKPLGAPFADVVNIKGTADVPLGVNLEADISGRTVGILLSAIVEIDIPAFGKPVQLKASSVGRLLKSGPSYALMGVMEGATLPLPFGKVPPVTVTVASGDIDNVLIPAISERMDISHGISLYWNGKSPVPQICDSQLIFSFSVKSLREFGGEVTCPLNLVFLKKKLKSINFIQLSEISLGFNIKRYKTVKETGITVGAGFNIATGSADCSDKSSSSECLSADISVGVSTVKAIPPAVSGMVLDVGMAMRGVWLNPLGLRNFALVNPSLGVGVMFPTGNVPPILKKLKYGITVLWKRPKQKEWPAALLDFNKWPSVNKEPDLTKNPGFLTASSHFHYEQYPHDSWYLPKGVPKFACKFVVSKMTLSDMANILLDVVDSFTTGKLPNLDLSFIDKFIAFEFYIDAQLSLLKTEVFTPGLFLKAGAAGNLFGLKFDFKIDINAPLDISIAGALKFVKNPLSILENVGLSVSADVSLPFGLGEAKMLGVLSSKKFLIECKMGIGLGSLKLASVHFIANYEVKKPKALLLAMHSEINLGFFGKVEMGGRLDSKSLSLYGGLDLSFFGLRFCGNVQAMIDSKQKCYKTKKGKKTVVPCFFVQFDALVKLGALGEAKFLGRVENKGIKIKATLENNIDKAIESVIKDAFKAIFGKEKNSKVADQLAKYLGKIVASAIPIKKVDFELDTISKPGKLALELEFQVMGIKVVFPKINIKIKGGGRRLSGGGTPGRDYTHVEAYEAEYRRLHPEYDAEETALEDPFRRGLKSTIDCTKDKGGFKIKDLVDMIVDAIDLPLLASKLKLCLPGLVKNMPKGERCASDNQCKDYKTFPNGQWCDRNGKPSGGIACTGTCQPRYVGGKKCPLLRDAACKSDDCICKVCANEKTKKLSHGKKCVNDGDCEGWCSGKGGAGCLGTCVPFLETGAKCSGSVTAKLNDYKCKGKRECSCNACTGPGDKTLGGPNDNKAKNLEACWGECDNDSQCAKGLKCFQRSKGEKIPGCTGAGSGKDWDYCYGKKTLGGTNDNKAKNLKSCWGECDSDSQCATGLKCFQRSNGEEIPGCSGPGAKKDWDYCYDPYAPGENSPKIRLLPNGKKCAKNSQCANGYCKGKTGAACTGTCTAFLKTGQDCSGSPIKKVNDDKCLGKRQCVCKRCTEENGQSTYGAKCAKDSQCNWGWCDGKSGAACSGTCKKFVGTGGKCGGSITAKLNDYKCTRKDGLGRCKSSKCYILKLKGKSCGKYNNWECKSDKCKCQKWKFLKCTGGWECE